MMDFESILREHGLKSTPQRSVILSQIYDSGHIDIEQLHKRVIGIIKIPLGTLYRALTELSTVGILTAISINGLKTHYEISKPSHAHLVCDECGSICDVEYNASNLLENIDLRSFQIKSTMLMAHGVCVKCKR
jgi:Fur family transcriptional regulator, peroxide stress response regulator